MKWIRRWRVRRRARAYGGKFDAMMRDAFPRIEPRGTVVPADVPVIGVVPMTWGAIDYGDCPACGHEWDRGELVGTVGRQIVCAICLDVFRITGTLLGMPWADAE